MKKLVGLAGGLALLAAVAAPVFANYGGGGRGGSSDVAIVGNSAEALANTGYNVQGNYFGGDLPKKGDVTVGGNNSMTTGDATAYAGALVVANTHVGCGCEEGRHRKGHEDVAIVGNSAFAGANTGYNLQGNAALVGKDGPDASAEGGGGYHHRRGGSDVVVGGDNTMTTGVANSTARAWVIVNTHWAD